MANEDFPQKMNLGVGWPIPEDDQSLVGLLNEEGYRIDLNFPWENYEQIPDDCPKYRLVLERVDEE